MVKTTTILKQELAGFANPQGKIARLVREGKLIPLVRGLYEDDPSTSGACLAGSICGPSYLSFEYALSRHGLIPEAAAAYTSATCGKRKTKRFDNAFGIFEYRDVPATVFGLGVELRYDTGCPYWIAAPEKALCDQLHKLPPASNQADLEELLLGYLRVDDEGLLALRLPLVLRLAGRYRCGELATSAGDGHCYERHLDQVVSAVKEWAMRQL